MMTYIQLNKFYRVIYGLRSKSLLMRIMPSSRHITSYCALKKDSHCQIRLILSHKKRHTTLFLSSFQLSLSEIFSAFRNCCIFHTCILVCAQLIGCKVTRLQRMLNWYTLMSLNHHFLLQTETQPNSHLKLDRAGDQLFYVLFIQITIVD